MRSFSASLISGLNYFCIDSVQKPSTFKPPHRNLIYRPRCPGRSMLGTLFPWKQNALIAFCGSVRRLMQLSADAEAGWHVSSAWPIHTTPGMSSIAWEWITPSSGILLCRWHLALFSFMPKMRSVETLAQQGEVIMQPSPCYFHRYFHRAGVWAPPAAFPEGLGGRR